MSATRGLPVMRAVLNARYRRYVQDYKQYLRHRGFGEHSHDSAFVWRGFLECWLQPGFHRFWQVWNPGIGYFVYKLYVCFGGKKRRRAATLAAFLVSGLVHNLVASVLLWRWDFPLPFTFALFGVLTLAFRGLDMRLYMARWPRGCHLAINGGLVILGFDFGFRMDNLVSAFLGC